VATGVSTTVMIGSISFAGFPSPYTNLIADFNTELLEGHSYTLTVDLKGTEVIFAGSNIYWDGTKLTFDGPGASESAQRTQGLFFKWGSLVGMSPALTNGSSLIYSTDSKVYISEYNSGSPTWSTTNIYSYGNIPHTSTPTALNEDLTEHYLTEDAQNTAAQWNAKKGDICRYLSENGFGPGGNWRMPTAAEFAVGTTGATWSESNPKPAAAMGWERLGPTGWPNVTTASGGTNNDGTTVILTGGGKFCNGIFPPSGRYTVVGYEYVYEEGVKGFYWSSTTRGNSTVSYLLSMLFNQIALVLDQTFCNVTLGASVRCVKN
jgi:hypothetical protein